MSHVVAVEGLDIQGAEQVLSEFDWLDTVNRQDYNPQETDNPHLSWGALFNFHHNINHGNALIAADVPCTYYRGLYGLKVSTLRVEMLL